MSYMEIKLVGQKTVLIKGKKEAILVNPTAEIVTKNSARVLMYTSLNESGWKIEGDKVPVIGPGEYEVGGIEINGWADGSEGVVYTAVIDGITVGILGKIKENLSEKKIEKINRLDVLVTEVNNAESVGAKVIIELAKKWGANYLVPVGEEVGSMAMKKFLDEADSEGLEPVEALKVDKDDLPDGLEVAVLK